MSEQTQKSVKARRKEVSRLLTAMRSLLPGCERALKDSPGIDFFPAAVKPFPPTAAHTKEAEAREILEEAAKKCDAAAWPFPVIRHLRGELSEDELMSAAGDEAGRKTEARTYLGLRLLAEGKGAEARRHFEWVREYGHKRFFEYPLAVAELGRLGP